MRTRTVNLVLHEGFLKALHERARAEAGSRHRITHPTTQVYLQWWEDGRRLQAYRRGRTAFLALASGTLWVG